MIQQANKRDSEAGIAKKSERQGVRVGVFSTRTVCRAFMAMLMLCPMASFEQDGRNRENHRQAVAVHRQKPVQGRAISCCDPAGGGAEAASTTRSVQVNMPDTRSWEKADREMIRNHATADEVLLPSMKAPLFEEADADMDIMFHLSNASWMTGVATADNDIDLGFRIENMSLPGINAILEGDAELHTRFQAEHVTT